MKYSLSEIKRNIPEINVKEYFSRMEKKELVKLGIIAGAAGALTITAAIIISKKLKKKKTAETIEIDAENSIFE